MQEAMDTTTPLLSVVIVAYNSKDDLETCLPSLARQDIPHEVIVVDNNSSDETAEWIRLHYPRARVLPLPDNIGFAAGTNVGLRSARGRYALALNPDTEVRRGALRELLHVAQQHPRSFINPKLLLPEGTINTCGNQMHYTGITTCIGLGEDSATYRGMFRPPALSGAAVLAHRDAWQDVGGFDERFFLYMEDADLSLRARLRGYELLCACEAEVTHRYDLKMSAQKMYYLERNRLLMLFTAFERRTLRRMIGGLVLTELATWAYAALKGPSYIGARRRGYVWLWQHRHESRNVRASRQAQRQASDSELIVRMTSTLPLDQLIGSSRVRHAVGTIVRQAYDFVHPIGRRVRATHAV
jgi:GT2 family glycosyltransferase